MRLLLLRPPRYVWPFNSETSAFWQPLGLLCLAAAVRAELPDVEVEVLDAPARKCGWQSLRALIAKRRIDVLGIGEETVSAHEGLRAAALAKELHPGCLVVAGGPYYAYALQQTLGSGCIDVVVRGEGERTFVELLRHAAEPSAWPSIDGLAFRAGEGQITVTPPRKLIADLDSLPFPAYDLVAAGDYGRRSRNHPDLVSVEHSRGCVDECAFCILWKQMGESREPSGKVRPRYRTQSPERSFETVERLYREFGRKTFGWVDPTFNASPHWTEGWTSLMLRSELMDAGGRPKTLHTAWMRADCVVRDEKLGLLEKLVKAGLRRVMIGVERDDAAGLALLNKHHNDAAICREAFSIFRSKYPEVFTIGTLIFGLPGDTQADLKRLYATEYDMGMDFGLIIPLTPNPGTRTAEEARRDGRIAHGELAAYNFHTPVCTTKALSLREQDALYWKIMLTVHPRRIARTWKGLFRDPSKDKRRVHRALLAHAGKLATRGLVNAVLHPGGNAPALYSRRPSWYDD